MSMTKSYNANILLRRGDFESGSDTAVMLVFMESQIPNPTSPQNDVCYPDEHKENFEVVLSSEFGFNSEIIKD